MGIDLTDYEAVFGEGPGTAYEQQTIDQIVRNRRTLEDELFVDRLLKALGIKKRGLIARVSHARSILWLILPSSPQIVSSPCERRSGNAPQRYHRQ